MEVPHGQMGAGRVELPVRRATYPTGSIGQFVPAAAWIRSARRPLMRSGICSSRPSSNLTCREKRIWLRFSTKISFQGINSGGCPGRKRNMIDSLSPTGSAPTLRQLPYREVQRMRALWKPQVTPVNADVTRNFLASVIQPLMAAIKNEIAHQKRTKTGMKASGY
jgi:hypothetical protein